MARTTNMSAESTNTVAAEPTMSLKLLIDTNGRRVVFAEADKNFVDFLFHMMSLPVGTVIGLVRDQVQGRVCSLPNVYESIENLDDFYMKPNLTKDSILKPVNNSCLPRPRLALNGAPPVKKFYGCASGGMCSYYVSDELGATCPLCEEKMRRTRTYVAPRAAKRTSREDEGEGGFVRGVVTYMVTDDLVVKPMSTMSVLTLLNKFNIKEVGDLEEKVVNLGMNEAVKLLNASLQSKKVFTDVFLNGIGIKRERWMA